MDWLYSLLDNSSVPVVTALILGVLTAVSPCPLATNLTAVAYLGREFRLPAEEQEDKYEGHRFLNRARQTCRC